jgi:protein TonB
MAYADQQLSGNRLTAVIIVALIHIALGYALVTGLAYEAVTKVIKKVTTVDIKEEEQPPPPPPPPPPDNAPPPPPMVAPPPMVNVAPPAAPVFNTVPVAPPAAPPPVLAPPAPAAPRFTPVAAAARGAPGDWATPDDYPSRPLREGVQGTSGFRVTIGTNGRVTACEITSSSGNAELDAATCKLVTARARFTPAKDGEGQLTTGVYANRVKWQIPKD